MKDRKQIDAMIAERSGVMIGSGDDGLAVQFGRLRVIASWGSGWDHVSVSLETRCPLWEEMEHVKRLFFHDDEAAMQLHPPVADYRNVHPYCLHIWRPQNQPVPLPPGWMVAPSSKVELAVVG